MCLLLVGNNFHNIRICYADTRRWNCFDMSVNEFLCCLLQLFPYNSVANLFFYSLHLFRSCCIIMECLSCNTSMALSKLLYPFEAKRYCLQARSLVGDKDNVLDTFGFQCWRVCLGCILAASSLR